MVAKKLKSILADPKKMCNIVNSLIRPQRVKHKLSHLKNKSKKKNLFL